MVRVMKISPDVNIDKRRIKQYKQKLNTNTHINKGDRCIVKKQTTSIAKRIKALRKRRLETQDQLAQLLGVDRVTLARWEMGIRSPRNQSLRKILDLEGQPPGSTPTPKKEPDLLPLITSIATCGLAKLSKERLYALVEAWLKTENSE